MAADSDTSPSPVNVIAITAATIGLFSGVASSTVGVDHARDVYEAARGGSAGLDDYVTVGTAFWDGFPIAVAVAVVIGMLVYGVYVSAAFLRYGAGLIALAAGGAASAVDPAAHLTAYQRAIQSPNKDTASILSAYFEVYGSLAAVLACLAGAGVGAAIALWVKQSAPTPQ